MREGMRGLGEAKLTGLLKAYVLLPSRAEANAVLAARIRAVHEASRQTSGYLSAGTCAAARQR